MPEIIYLIKMSSTCPEKVVDIMLQIPISKENLNPSVIDGFLIICSGSDLPADQLARVIPKIKQENWVKLLGYFNYLGFEYEKMIQTLRKAKDYSSIIDLSEAILAIRPKKEIGEYSDNPFYLNEIYQTEILKSLVEVDDKHAEKALSATNKALNEIIQLGEKSESDSAFSIQDKFPLWEVDIFKINIGSMSEYGTDHDVADLIATSAQLAKKTLTNKCNDPKEAQRIFKEYCPNPPKSKLMWRLRAYVLSLCKDALKKIYIKQYLVSLSPKNQKRLYLVQSIKDCFKILLTH